jgi:hypothetical protein
VLHHTPYRINGFTIKEIPKIGGADGKHILAHAVEIHLLINNIKGGW